MSITQESIRQEIARQGRIGVDPRHVESYMRLEHATLDSLSWTQFRQEVAIGIECALRDGLNDAERLAKALGL